LRIGWSSIARFAVESNTSWDNVVYFIRLNIRS
jgi:hypothetical protein